MTDTVQRLIDYLYLGEYAADQILPGSINQRPNLQAHIEMFAAGSELKIPILQEYATYEYSKTLLTCSFTEYVYSIRQVYATSSKDNPRLRLVVLDYAWMSIANSGTSIDRLEWVKNVSSVCPEFVDDLKLGLKLYQTKKW
jgi:hypothetical protein